MTATGKTAKDGRFGKVCTACGVYKVWDEYHLNKARKDGRAALCKVCTNKITRHYRETGKWEMPAGSNGRTPPEMEAEAAASDARDRAAEEGAGIKFSLNIPLQGDYSDIPEPGPYDVISRELTASALEQVAETQAEALEQETRAQALTPPAGDAYTLRDFLDLHETPSAFVHPQFCVVAVVMPDGLGNSFQGLYLLSPDGSGPRQILPWELVAYCVSLLGRPDEITGKLYY